MSSSLHAKRGITLVEITVIAVILFVLGAVLFPVFARRPMANRRSEASNHKQIALGFLMYIQDYDERFPLGVGYGEPSVMGAYHAPSPLPPPGIANTLGTAKQTFAQSWGPDRTLPDGRNVPGLLSPYVKSNALFVDPQAPRPAPGTFTLDYLYNDLLIGAEQDKITAPAHTVLTTNSENRFANAGHALDLNAPPVAARFNAKGGCDAGQGATVGREARFRHTGGANFAYTDGHVKWSRGGDTDNIFFPARSSASISAVNPVTKRQEAPIPGKSMTWNGRTYQGTFHLR